MAFNRDRSRGSFDRGGGRPSSGRGFSDRGSRGPIQMHQAVCDKCRKECEVPFRPTSGKPVYCSSCFDRPTSARRPEGRSFQRPSFEEKREPDYGQQFAEINAKLDKILNILEPIVQEAETIEKPSS